MDNPVVSSTSRGASQRVGSGISEMWTPVTLRLSPCFPRPESGRGRAPQADYVLLAGSAGENVSRLTPPPSKVVCAQCGPELLSVNAGLIVQSFVEKA